jgi:hypothetical protein
MFARRGKYNTFCCLLNKTQPGDYGIFSNYPWLHAQLVLALRPENGDAMCKNGSFSRTSYINII